MGFNSNPPAKHKQKVGKKPTNPIAQQVGLISVQPNTLLAYKHCSPGLFFSYPTS